MARTVREPEEIVDEDYEQVLERVCAIDVAKDFGQVCVRTPHADGKRVSKVFEVGATAGEVLKLGASLIVQRIQMVTMESTSDYWRIFFYLLEACGLKVQLVNARDVKNVPNRPKTDKIDAIWLAKLTERGMLRASFVPPHEFRVLRDYTRTRADLIRDRTRLWSRLEKLLEDALIKVTSVASTIATLSVRDMIEALIAGERNPERLADLARGVMRKKRADLVKALDGRFDDHHADIAKILLGQIDSLTAQIGHIATRIEQLIDELGYPAERVYPVRTGRISRAAATGTTIPGAVTDSAQQPATPQCSPRSPLQRLTDIPGISVEAAQVILAEIGYYMTRFPTPEQLCSWAHLTPQVKQSGNTRAAAKSPKATPTSKLSSAAPPRLSPAPTPSPAPATAAWSNAAARPRPSSPSPTPSSSSSGTCSPTPTPPTTILAPTTTKPVSTRNDASVTSSNNSKRSACR